MSRLEGKKWTDWSDIDKVELIILDECCHVSHEGDIKDDTHISGLDNWEEKDMMLVTQSI